MGIGDHEDALKAPKAKFDAFIKEIDEDPGLSEEQKEATFQLVNKVQAGIEDAAGKLEKGLKVGTLARDLFKNPLGLLGKVGGLLGL